MPAETSCASQETAEPQKKSASSNFSRPASIQSTVFPEPKSCGEITFGQDPLLNPEKYHHLKQQILSKSLLTEASHPHSRQIK
jgi:hypothetical protein